MHPVPPTSGHPRWRDLVPPPDWWSHGPLACMQGCAKAWVEPHGVSRVCLTALGTVAVAATVAAAHQAPTVGGCLVPWPSTPQLSPRNYEGCPWPLKAPCTPTGRLICCQVQCVRSEPSQALLPGAPHPMRAASLDLPGMVTSSIKRRISPRPSLQPLPRFLGKNIVGDAARLWPEVWPASPLWTDFVRDKVFLELKGWGLARRTANCNPMHRLTRLAALARAASVQTAPAGVAVETQVCSCTAHPARAVPAGVGLSTNSADSDVGFAARRWPGRGRSSLRRSFAWNYKPSHACDGVSFCRGWLPLTILVNAPPTCRLLPGEP